MIPRIGCTTRFPVSRLQIPKSSFDRALSDRRAHSSASLALSVRPWESHSTNRSLVGPTQSDRKKYSSQDESQAPTVSNWNMKALAGALLGIGGLIYVFSDDDYSTINERPAKEIVQALKKILLESS